MLYLQKVTAILALAGVASGIPGYTFHNTSHPSHNGSDVSSKTVLDEHTIEALKVLGKCPNEYRAPGSVPDSRFPAGTHLLKEIKHIVFLMLENHSYDNIYGTLDRRDADGFPIDRCTGKPAVSNKFANGTKLFAYQANQTCIRTPGADAPTQNYLSSHLQYDNGSLDAFVTGGGFKPIAMAYHTKRQLPFLHGLGRLFPVMDRYFCSLLGPTWPNRRFFMAGTAAGVTATGQNLTGLVSNTTTIFAELTKYNISWRDYVPGFDK
jgi:phospholipase C